MSVNLHHEHGSLDDAWGQALSGQKEAALRAALAILESDPQKLGAASLVLELLTSEGHSEVGPIVARLVDAYTRRSDLPAATAVAAIAKRAGLDAARFYRAIARAFGKGSPRLADVSLAPPPLPNDAVPSPELAAVSGAALFARAEDALDDLLRTRDPVEEGKKVSILPLFSALPSTALAQLLEGFVLQNVSTGTRVIEQGEEGREAFVVVRGVLRAERRAHENDEPEVLAMLGPGAIFGEMALVSEAPRAASVLAVEPTQLLTISREILESIATTEEAIGRELSAFCRHRMMTNLMRHSAILSGVARPHRDELMGRFEARVVNAGEVIVREGDSASGLFLIASGGVRVTREESDGDRIILAELGPGDVVGEISLVLRRPASATVTAAHPTVALHLSPERFQETIREHPTLLAELYDLATRRDDETRSVVAQQALDVEDVVLV